MVNLTRLRFRVLVEIISERSLELCFGAQLLEDTGEPQKVMGSVERYLFIQGGLQFGIAGRVIKEMGQVILTKTEFL